MHGLVERVILDLKQYIKLYIPKLQGMEKETKYVPI